MIKVGMILPLRGTWGGGLNYYRNLLKSYQQFPDPALKLEVFTDSEDVLASYRCDAIAINPCPSARLLSLRRPKDLPRNLVNRALGFDPLLLRIVERNRIDLLSHNAVGRQRSVPTLFWQADFQHKFFPDYFKKRHLAERDTEIENTALWGNILLSSEAAANDFRRFYPELSGVRTHILRFATASALDVPLIAREQLDARYPTSEPYLFLPNQFWKHKNHKIVVEALAKTPSNVRVICTGAMNEPRDPNYVPSLLEKVKSAGLEKRFVCLGSVPYSDLIALMHYSVAVLQPSLFEGWSTSVEESKAMRKRIILSNLDVHLEQAPERGLYYSSHSPDELAERMIEVYREFDPAIELAYAGEREKYKTAIERDWILKFAEIIKSL